MKVVIAGTALFDLTAQTYRFEGWTFDAQGEEFPTPAAFRASAYRCAIAHIVTAFPHPTGEAGPAAQCYFGHGLSKEDADRIAGRL